MIQDIPDNTPLTFDNEEQERSIDPLDQASKLTDRERQLALDRVRAQIAQQEPPLESIDEAGVRHRYCIYCEDEIPEARIALVPNVVLCVMCKSKQEGRDHIAYGRGGVMNYGD